MGMRDTLRQVVQHLTSSTAAVRPTASPLAGESPETGRPGEPARIPSESTYERLLNTVPAAILLSKGNLEITYKNPFTEVLTGFSLNELTEKSGFFWSAIAHPEDLAKIDRALQLTNQGEACQLPFRFFHRAGIEMWGEMRLLPLEEDGGTSSGFLCIVLDTTASTRYQRQLETRTREVHDFVHFITHDLQAPVLTVKGMTGLLEETLGDSRTPEVVTAIDHLRRSAERLEKMITSVLQYSQLGTAGIAAAAVGLRPLLDEVLTQAAHLGDSSFELTCSVPADCVVLGDELKLYQVFSNLVHNSIKYRHPERTLQLDLTAQPNLIGRTVTVTVRDNGIGIPAEKIDSLFRPFQRFSNGEEQGYGIGLASVKKLLELMGGAVRVESVHGQGSSFHVTLRAPSH